MYRAREQCTARTNSVTPPDSRTTRLEGGWEPTQSETDDGVRGVVQFVGSQDKNRIYDGTDDELSARLTDTELEGFSSAEEDILVSSDEEVSGVGWSHSTCIFARVSVPGFCTTRSCVRATVRLICLSRRVANRSW